MRPKGKILLFILLAVALWVPVALASTVSLNSSHALELKFTELATSGAVGPNSGQVHSNAYGNAYYPYDFSVNADTQTITPPAPVTATANAPGAIWLQVANTVTSYNGPSLTGSSLTMANNMQGGGPYPSGPFVHDGYIYQYADQQFTLNFTAPADGSYLATLSDIYNLHYGLTQAGGNPFVELYGWSQMYVTMTSPTGGANQWKQVLLDSRSNIPGALSDFSIDRLGSALNFAIILDDLKAGNTVTFWGDLTTYYRGYTTVPVPPTVLLLGSGLLGLGLIGVRRRKKS